MGTYTEIYVNVDFKENTPKEVIDVVKAICDKDMQSPHLQDKPSRWFMLFNDGSFYLPCTECGLLTFNEIRNSYSLLGKGDIKNYGSEIELFFEFIEPWVEDPFMGYHRYEEDDSPTLVFKKGYSHE